MYINEYNDNEKLVSKITHYRFNHKTTKQINEYNKDDKLIKQTFYQYDGKTINLINEYNENEILIKQTFYVCDEIIDYIKEFNPDKATNKIGKLFKDTTYQEDGKTIDYIDEYDNGTIIKTTYYKSDGTIDFIDYEDYDDDDDDDDE